jgi:nicotinamidase-related amidase
MDLFTPEDSVMLPIDHQVGTLTFCRNIPQSMIVQNTRALARFAKALDMPVVLTTSQEEDAQGPLIPAMKELLPDEYETRVKRAGSTK